MSGLEAIIKQLENRWKIVLKWRHKIKIEKKFWHYFNYAGYPVINEIVEPVCPYEEEYHTSFLVYAENEEMAFKLAMEHIYEGRKMDKFYGTYKGEKYSGVACIM